MSVLRRGDRVADKRHRLGVVTHRELIGGRWRYMVRWDGNRHESGEYGIGSLKRLRKQVQGGVQ